MNIIDVGLQFNGAFTYGNKPNKIVLHNADASSCTIQDINEWHKNNGWIGCGYHFLVRKDGSVYKGRPENVIGAHCQGWNTGSLGICFEGAYMTETMPSIQYNAGIELIKYLFDKYGTLAIFGHKELFSTDCPGTNFPLDNFKNMKTSDSWKYGWNKDDKGWFFCTDTTNKYYYRESWQLIEGCYYLFNHDGYALQSKWYQNNDGHWFYLKDNCVMARNEWFWVDGECYYASDNGAIYQNSYTPDGYFCDKDGEWVSSVPQRKVQ